MKLSYDYEEMLDELKEMLELGENKLDDEIQVLRGKEIYEGYRVVDDWYLSERNMNKLILDDTDDEYELSYLKYKTAGKLETMTVKDLLEEMEEVNRII